MRGQSICDVWARIPGLNAFWCFQIQWRIGIDEEVIAALTEPRYPGPRLDDQHPSLDTVILVQTIYLCQLFLHLQEFDPGVGPEQRDGEEELIRVFQDSLAREFNNSCYGQHVRPRDDNPAPDGETLERVVRGLMKAERDEHPPTPSPPPPAAETSADRSSSSSVSMTPENTGYRNLQQLLVQILAELNRPLFDKARRYEQTFGPRTDETWAARFATRVMQWRWSMRPPSGLTEEIIRVFPHDVHPLDEEGLEVYRIVRNAAPGHIHLVTPLQPDLQPSHPPPLPRVPGLRHHGHQRSGSSGMKVQPILASSLPTQRSPAQAPSNSTPRTPQQTMRAESSVKRGSLQEEHLPPSKRRRSILAWEGSKEDDTDEAAETTAAAAEGDIPIRSAPAVVETHRQSGSDAKAAAEETNHLLWRVLDEMTNLGRQIDGMQQDLGQRLSQLDDRLKHIEEWISDEV